MQAYSNPDRENDPHALPDLEVFHRGPDDCTWADENGDLHNDGPGWYYWYCFPGCMPDSDPIGPFATKADALADARSADLEVGEEG